MDLKEIFQLVLSKNPSLTEEEFLRMVEEKKKALGEYFTDEVIAKVVASELGVSINQNRAKALEMTFKDLISGLTDVTVSGRVIKVSQVRTFRKGIKSGKTASLLLADNENRTLRVVLWNDKTDIISKKDIGINSLIRVSHGYVKEGRMGQLELHLGKRGQIEVLGEAYMKIGSLKEGDGPVNVKGKVISEKPLIRKVQTSRGEEVLVASFEVEDETGKVWVSFWREHAEKIRKMQISKGIKLKLKNFYVKKGFSEGLEIFTRKNSSFEILNNNSSG